MDDLEFIRRKNGQVLLFDGHQYHKLRTYKNGNTIWNCSRIKKERCRGSITLADNRTIIKSVQHCCKANYEKNEIDKAVKKMREEAMRTDVPIPQIFKKAKKPLEDLGLDKVTTLPELKNVKTAMYSSRKKSVFKSVEDVTIPEQHQSLVLCEYTHGTCRIIVFCTEDGKKRLIKAKEFFVDGTFFSCPEPFQQLYTMHGDFGNSSSETNVQPILYALMSDKKEESYRALFAMIKSQVDDWVPTKIHLDFERAANNAIKDIFQYVKIVNCYYHFTNSLWKMAKKLHIKKNCETRIVGLCSSLPLLPKELIKEGYEYIKAESPKTQNIIKYQKYVEKTWLKTDDSIAEWCVYGERHRTNNVVESYNALLNNATKKRRPLTLLRLLNIICEIEEDITVPSPRVKEYIERDEFVLNCQLQLLHHEITIGHFLEKLR